MLLLYLFEHMDVLLYISVIQAPTWVELELLLLHLDDLNTERIA